MTRSSIITPMYDELRSRTNGLLPFIKEAALIPAISPCAAASSYPDVPFIWPERNKPETSFVSRVAFSCAGGKKSYSIA